VNDAVNGTAILILCVDNKLLLPLDCIDMDTNTINKVKRDEIIEKFY